MNVKPKALNGRVCCVLDLPCCIPPPGIVPEDTQAEALATVIMDACPPEMKPHAVKIAQEILAHVDLVPKGVGKAIVDGYRQWMVKEDPHTKKQD